MRECPAAPTPQPRTGTKSGERVDPRRAPAEVAVGRDVIDSRVKGWWKRTRCNFLPLKVNTATEVDMDARQLAFLDAVEDERTAPKSDSKPVVKRIGALGTGLTAATAFLADRRFGERRADDRGRGQRGSGRRTGVQLLRTEPPDIRLHQGLL
jgi:hypothetical protein